jgi:aminopeptidase-like protein
VEAFERTREGWQNADGLARIDPGIFASLVVSALPAAYQEARPEERAVLVKILRKQLMGTDQELSLDEFSSRIGLDRQFASAVLNAESLRRERSLSLRIALGDYSVRQFVCVRLLDEGMSQGLI